MKRQKAGVGKVNRVAEQKQALGLRKSGATYAEIAEQLKISEPTAWRRVQRALKAIAKLSAKEAEEVKILELARYDFYLRSLDKKIRAGDEKSVRVALVVSERRSRLLGLDQPIKVEVDLDKVDALLRRAAAGDEEAKAKLRELSKKLPRGA